jgi:glycogen debranching enzyme
MICYTRVSNLNRLADRALSLLRRNDTGIFTKPAATVYPFQWNWDSALVAIGLARVDPARGRQEVLALLRGQWTDGMVPHMVFHPTTVDYSPGPEIWGSNDCAGAPDVPTSGLTQPPVLATAVRALHEASPDTSFLEQVVPALEAWHAWLHRVRDLDGSGLLAILHPWESADNAPRFDDALARVEPDGIAVERSDRRRLADAERPTDRDYARYLALVEVLRRCGYRPRSLAEAPFAYVDLTFNSVLATAEGDLAWLWGELGGDGARARAAALRLREALGARWDEGAAVYRELDLHDGEQEVAETVGGLMPVYAGVPDEGSARRLFVESLWAPARYGPSPSDAPWAVTTVSKSSPAFDARRYWRGPVWINVNWFLLRGLERLGLAAEAEELRTMTLRLVQASGFSEYYHPATGEPLGSPEFSWSAALTLDLIHR